MIHAVTPYGRKGPSSRVRVYEWLDRAATPSEVSGYVGHHNSSPAYLARHPQAVVRAERRLRAMASDRPRRLLLHREASPLSRGALERRLLESSDFGVYDFDDALQWDWGGLGGSPLRRLAPKAPKAHAAVRNAQRVIAGNAVLADWASQYSRDVVVIPSCVSPAAYRAKVDYRVADPPRLGWVGSRDNEIYLELIAPALLEIHRRTGSRLTLLGTVDARLGELEVLVDRVKWTEAAQHDALATFDVGLAPLPDEPYTRGKCGYKLLQYGAAGVPSVASPVGVNETILAELRMPAARDAGEWVAAILDLLLMPAVDRAALGGRAREVVQERYSYDVWLPHWKEAVGLTVARPDRETRNAPA